VRAVHFTISAFFVLISVICVGCGGGSCGPQSSVSTVTATITTGAISVTDSHGLVELSSDQATFHLAQTGATDQLPFDLEMGTNIESDGGAITEGAMRLSCANIATQSLATSTTMSLVPFCGCVDRLYCIQLDIFRSGTWEQFDLSGVDGTARIEASGDPTQAGHTAVTIDVPTTTVHLTNGTTTATLTIDSMRGNQERVDAQTPGSCGGGGAPVTYGGWLPGGD
jgi:hypothetical protein